MWWDKLVSFKTICGLALLYIIAGFAFILGPMLGPRLIRLIKPDNKIIIYFSNYFSNTANFAALAFGFAILFFGISVLFSAASMRTTADFYFDDKKKILMDYNQKISEICSQNSSYDLGYVLDQIECDLIALSNFCMWASKDKIEGLINNQIMKIIRNPTIRNAKSKETCGNIRNRICKIVQIGLKICPEHPELKELEQKENCAKLLMKGK